MRRRRAFSLLAALALTITSCTPSEPPSATAEAFFDALARGDQQELRSLSPTLSDNPEQLEMLLAGATDILSARAASSQTQGNRAEVTMVITVAGPPVEEIRLTVPLSGRRGRWIIDGTLSAQRRIEMIPLERSDE